jgi:putative hydrolase of the HAD superfamily
MTSAVLFDLDGVLRRWDPAITDDAERRCGLPSGAVLKAAFEPALLQQAVTGGISDAEWRATVARRLVDRYGSTGHDAVHAWSGPSGEVVDDVLDLVREQRARRRVALITNATTRLDDDLVALGLAGEFDAVVNSSRVGVAKPDRVFFRRASEELGVDPSSCAVVDDTTVHVEAARSLGMRAHRFEGVPGLAAFLSGLDG